MPTVLQFNAPSIRDRFSHVASYLSIDNGFKGFCDFVQNLNDSLEIPKSLSHLGVLNPDISSLTKMALSDPSCAGNPLKLTELNVKQLFEECL